MTTLLRHLLLGLALLVPMWARAELPVAADVGREAITDRHCLECHGVAGFAVPTGPHGDTPHKPLFVAAGLLRESVHGKLSCLACHTDIDRLPHKRGTLAKVDCLTCHQGLNREPEALMQEINRGRAMVGLIPAVVPTPTQAHRLTREYAASLHGRLRKGDTARRNAECQECHGSHAIFPAGDKRSRSHRLSSPTVCGGCHAKALDDFRHSVHGAALHTPWKGKSAVCSDCHPSHRIDDNKLPASWREIAGNCGNCHAASLASYLSTYHGQMAWLGGKKAAKCSHCHASHATRRVTDPQDAAHPDHLLATCRECHKEATASFVAFRPHANTADFVRYPEMWLAGKAMVALVVLVLIFFYLHSFLWFRRSRRERREFHHAETEHVQRFSWPWRVNHWLLALSVMVLVATGMTAKYADSAWALAFSTWVGDPMLLGSIHRGAAVLFLTAVVGHVVAVLFWLLVRKRGRFQWFGPDSLLPRIQDWRDMKAQFLWFLGRGEAPRFDRWTYWEKFDYWAVYWGAVVVGTSGLLLWFPNFFARYLPGWIFNIATLLHGVEAFLAVTTLFVVHFFNNHFRPGKFPLDIVMFTGSWGYKEWASERPEECRRMQESGQLAGRLVPPPSRAARMVAHLFGFTLIGIGLLLLVLVVIGFSRRGLV